MEQVVFIKGRPYKQVGKYEIEYNQTWTAGSERDYSGTWNGSILGNFDSMKITVLPKNKTELSQLIKDLRAGFIPVNYYDFERMGFISQTFYRANFKVSALYISENTTNIEPIEISFIPERKR